jgi:hypothetical protein
MKEAQVFRSTLRSSNQPARQYELQIYGEYCTGDESALPPPNIFSEYQSGSSMIVSGLEVEKNRIDSGLQELMNIETNSTSQDGLILEKLIQDSINPDALTSGKDRIRSIQQVMASFTAHILLSSVIASLLLSEGVVTSIYARALAAILGIVINLIFNKYGATMSPCLAILCFGVFSFCLPFALTLIACLIGNVYFNHLLVQLSALSLGLSLYALTTKYEDWSGNDELLFSVASTTFASLVMTMIFSASLLAVFITGALVILVGMVICDCAKDNIVPANTIDQLLSDLIAIHFNIVIRSPFLFKLKFSRLARKANWF